jgi:hypothetical protein
LLIAISELSNQVPVIRCDNPLAKEVNIRPEPALTFYGTMAASEDV